MVQDTRGAGGQTDETDASARDRTPAADRRWPLADVGATVTTDPAVLRAWRADHRPFYAAVVMLPPSRPLEERRLAVLQALGRWISASAPGQPHVTISALGTDVAAARRAQALLGGDVEVLVTGADSFASAAFLHVASDAVMTLRSRLLRQAGPDVGASLQFVPHVTVGTYRRSMAMDDVRDRLEPLRELAPLRLRGSASVLRVDRTSPAGRLVPCVVPGSAGDSSA